MNALALGASFRSNPVPMDHDLQYIMRDYSNAEQAMRMRFIYNDNTVFRDLLRAWHLTSPIECESSFGSSQRWLHGRLYPHDFNAMLFGCSPQDIYFFRRLSNITYHFGSLGKALSWTGGDYVL